MGSTPRWKHSRAAIGKTGAEPYRPSVPTSNLAFFNCATPGFGPWVVYRDFWHKIDDLKPFKHVAGRVDAPRLSGSVRMDQRRRPK